MGPTIVQIEELFVRILENQGFLFGELIDSDEVESGVESAIRVQIEFTSDTEKGSISLIAPHSVACEIAAGMLGLDPEDIEDENEAIDSFKELVNVTGGNLITEAWGAEKIFDLSIPTSTTIDNAEWVKVLKTEGVLCFLVEDEPLLFSLSLNS